MIEKIKNYLTIDRIKHFFYYGVGGVGTMALNIAMYQSLMMIMDYKTANLIAIITSKLAAYVWNKNLVFRSYCKDLAGLGAEFFRFVIARGFTGVIDYFGVILLVEMIGFDKVYSKYALTIIVIIINYVLGKKAVFLDAKEDSEQN